MPKAFVLINSEPGSEEHIANDLKSTENVTELHNVYGVYDIIAKVEADSMEKINRTVMWKIRRLEKVRLTLTMIVVEG